MKKVWMVNSAGCTGCMNCQNACQKIYGVNRISIVQADGKFIPVVCQNCQNPPCVKACPVEAIRRSNDLMSIDLKECIGCGKCVEVCPFGAINIDPNGLAQKCDLCSTREWAACVKACKRGCLDIVEIDWLSSARREKYVQMILGVKAKPVIKALELIVRK